MRKNEPLDLHIPHRQSPLAILVILYEFIRRILSAFWPIVLIYVVRGRTSGQSGDPVYLYIGIGISLISVIGSLISYFRYYYYVTDTDLIIEKGLIERKKITVPFDRIQTINTEQKIIHQLFGVVKLEIDTAGSKKKEIAIDALEQGVAEQIKSFLLLKKKYLQEESSKRKPTPPSKSQDLHQVEPLIRLSITDLVKIGVSQNHIQTALLIIGFGIGFLDDIQEIINFDLYTWIQGQIGQASASYAIFLLMVLPFLLLITFIITLIRTVIRFYHQKVWIAGDGIQLESGLLTRHQSFIHRQKIQRIQWSQNPIKRIFKLFELRIYQASSQQEHAKKTNQIPGCYREALEALRDTTFPRKWFESMDYVRVSTQYRGRLWLYFGILPGILLGFLGYLQDGLPGFWFLVWIPLVWWWAGIVVRRWHIGLNDYALYLKHGFWEVKEDFIPVYKIQAVRLKQSPYQRSHQLATVSISTASGSLEIPYLPLDLAQRMMNYLLFRVESSHLAWM